MVKCKGGVMDSQSIDHKKELNNGNGSSRNKTGIRKNSIKTSKNSAKHYSMLIRKMSDGVALYRIIFDSKGKPYDLRFVETNVIFRKLLGKRKNEIIGKTVLEIIRKGEIGILNMFKKILTEILVAGEPMQFEVYSHKSDKYYGVTVYFPRKGYLATIISDVTEKKRLEDETKRIANLQDAIKTIGKVLLMNNGEEGLYQKICDALANAGFIRFVWIGLIEEGSFDVKPAAYAGPEKDYLSGIRVTWDDTPYGSGPTGTAIKTGKSFIMRDIEHDPRYALWRDAALKRRFKSSIALPLIYESTTIGALNIYSDRKDAFGKEEVEFLQEVADEIAMGIKSIRLGKELEESKELLQRTMEEVISAVASVVELKDPYSAGHQIRVSKLAAAIAEKMKLPEDKIEIIRIASLIHDIGKVAIPVELLTKPFRLSEQEFALIKAHPQVCYNILKNIPSSRVIADIILQHHERLDGSGYPGGLKGDEILLEAKIMAVADVIEAMGTYRSYKPALGIDKALKEISMNKGKLYDPDVVDACIKLFKEDEFKFE